MDATWSGAVRRLIGAHPLAALIVAALVLRAALTPLYANLPNGLLDEGFWTHWMAAIHREGVLNIFRSSDTDYVGYHWVLWLMTLVYESIGGGPYSPRDPSLHILVKMPSLIFDVALILVTYWATRELVGGLRQQTNDDRRPVQRKTLRQHTPDDGQRNAVHRGIGAPNSDVAMTDVGRRPERIALLAAAIIAFQPAVVYDSAVWAQTDSAITAAMLASLVLAVRGNAPGAGLILGLGFAVKPHPVIIAPLVALLLLRSGGWTAPARAGAAAAGVVLLILTPWIVHGDSGRIIDVYEGLFRSEHDRLSELAWNVWWISDHFGDPRETTQVFPVLPFLTYRLLSLGLSASAAALALAYAWSRPGLRGALVAGAYAAFAFYALPVGSHERYLYPFLALLLPVALADRRWLWLYVPVSATFFLNLVVVAPPIEALMDRWVYAPIGPIVAVVNMAMFTAFTAVLVRGVRFPGWPPKLHLRARSQSARQAAAS